MRIDTTEEGEKTATINRIDKKIMWIINHEDKMYMKMPAMVNKLHANKIDEDLTKIADKKMLAQRTSTAMSSTTA
jgi:hypothetical protein